MRRIRLVSLVLVAALAALPSVAGKGTDYGDGLSGRSTVKVAKLLANPERHLGETVRVKGTVTAVCEKMGCWMTLAPDDGADGLQVKVADGVIVFPVSARGRRAIAEGTLRRNGDTLRLDAVGARIF